MHLLIFYTFSNDTITQLPQSHQLCQHSDRERIWPVRLVWLLLHKFCKRLGNPLGGILSPSSSLVLWFSQGCVGLGLYGVLCMSLCVQMWMCHLSCIKKWARFTVLICMVSLPFYRQCPKLSRYFECWLPAVDTDLLSQRLAECQHCVSECMHGSAASSLS